jgi:hypothetical protein
MHKAVEELDIVHNVTKYSGPVFLRGELFPYKTIL